MSRHRDENVLRLPFVSAFAKVSSAQVTSVYRYHAHIFVFTVVKNAVTYI